MAERLDFDKCTSGKAEDFAQCVDKELPKLNLSPEEQAHVATNYLFASVEENLYRNRPADAKPLDPYHPEHPYGYDGVKQSTGFLKETAELLKQNGSKFELILDLNAQNEVRGYNIEAVGKKK